MINYIISESPQDYLDYIQTYQLDINECICFKQQNALDKVKGYKCIHIHITFHASKIDELKIKFVDAQIEMGNRDFLSFIEGDDMIFYSRSNSLLSRKFTPSST